MTQAAGLATNLSHDANEGTPESLYEVHGDASAALRAYSALLQPGQRQEYNRLLLSYLSSSSSPSALGDITEQMDEWEKKWKESDEYVPVRKKKLQECTITYNRSLIQFASGKPRHAAGPLLDLLRPILADTKSTLRDDLLDALSRSAFLVLDCILAISEARNLQELDETLTCESLVTWLDSLDFESMPKLKFLLELYKSRLDFAARDESGKMIDPKIRSVRKELRLAMEVLNQKLRPALTVTDSTVGETASVRSSSEVEGSSIHTSEIPKSHQESLLQGLNESALNLKAHYEELKGNSKKSLILCAEARSPSDESIYLNNLAIVYAANGKRNLALYACARSLRASSSEKAAFASNGTARPEPTWSKVHNAAILAFQAGNYVSAYECMANCVQNSKEYSERPKCWLRMAEACIGIHNESKKEREEERNQTKFVVVESNGEPKGILLSSSLVDTPLFAPQELNYALGSPNDLDQVSKQPLGRAFICLERVIGVRNVKVIDKDCLESARCSLAYLKLEVRDFQGASDTAMSILLENDEVYWQKTGGLRERLHKQRLACARLYLSEALSALGNPTSAMRLISQDDDSSFMNQLSVDLAGGILPNIDVNDVSKLLKAQIMVQTNASSVSASMSDLSVAEQLALSALQNSEESLRDSTSKSASYKMGARKALLFCMLREGNCEGALELLASA